MKRKQAAPLTPSFPLETAAGAELQSLQPLPPAPREEIY